MLHLPGTTQVNRKTAIPRPRSHAIEMVFIVTTDRASRVGLLQRPMRAQRGRYSAMTGHAGSSASLKFHVIIENNIFLFLF